MRNSSFLIFCFLTIFVSVSYPAAHYNEGDEKNREAAPQDEKKLSYDGKTIAFSEPDPGNNDAREIVLEIKHATKCNDSAAFPGITGYLEIDNRKVRFELF